MPSDPKPPPRIRDTRAGRDKVRQQGCRLTGQPWRPGQEGMPWHVDRFHVVPRDLGGDDVADNLIGVRHDLHMEWEHGPDGKAEVGPRIWRLLYDHEKQAALDKGPHFVLRYYGVTLDERSDPEGP